MPTNEPTAKRLEIKKYPNRRYYDATHSRHLTLEEIRNLVQQGYDLQVIDAKTGTDITGQVLTQIILELDTPKLDSFPVPLLVRIVRMNDQLTKEFVEKYFNQALQSFLAYQQQVEEQIRRTQGLTTAFPSVSAWTKAMLQPLASAFGAANEPPAAPSPPESARENTELRETVRNLQDQLSALQQRPAATRRRRTRRKKR